MSCDRETLIGDFTMIFTVIFATIAFMTGVWLLSLILKDASIVDRFWGLLFVFLSSVYTLQAEAVTWRAMLVLTLVAIWGVRLSLYIHFRNRGHGEDYRYVKMRKHHGSSFWWYSYLSVFMLQGLLAVIVSAPLYVLFTGSANTGFIWSDAIGLLLWTIGFIFEAFGDWQLTRFKQDPSNKGKLLTTGLWSLTRHPNYFGDACLWFGYFFFALSQPLGIYSLFGPVVMLLSLMYVTGAKLLEKRLKNSKPGYKEYIEKTPAFFPKIW